MPTIGVNTLRIRGEPSRAGAMAFMVEDALRTAIGEDGRLVLVRELPLGMIGAKTPPYARTRQAETAWRRATGSRVHGAASDAAAANCVWFASASEARRTLLAHLANGTVPRGWFWRLAVPEWRGQPLDAWLAAEIGVAPRRGRIADVAELIAAVGSAQAATVARAMLTAFATMPAAAIRIGDPAIPGEPGHPAEETASAPPLASDPATAVSRDLTICRDRIAPGLRDPIEALVRALGAAHPLSAALLEHVLLAASPALALSRPRLAGLVAAYRASLSGVPATARPAYSRAPMIRRPDDAAATFIPADRREPAEPDPSPVSRPVPAARAVADDIAAIPSHGEAAPAAITIAAVEQFSAAAGLFLALPALRRMGFREWLAEQPALLVHDPGRTLLRFIATHHRVPCDDPVMALFGLDDEPVPDWARLWRAALDRWLRRTARVPLARLVWRGGWLSVPGEQAVSVRFPLAAVDLRLRRRALDADPGWTDWLGLSVRYRFSGEAAR